MGRQKVVIIGHGYTSRLGIIRSLADSGCEIIVVSMVFHGWMGRMIRFEGGKPIDCCSKYVSRYYYCQAKDKNGLIRLLLEKCTDPDQKTILIPDSDFSAAVVDNNKDLLRERFVFPNIDDYQGSVIHWMDKTVQKEHARKIGLNVAEGVIVEIKNGQYELPENISYPCFTKPLATISGGKQFLRRCGSEADLLRVLDKVAGMLNTNVLVEDYKHIDTEYAVVGFSDGKNVVIPAIIEFIVNSKSHFGIARQGIVKPVDGFEEILSKFREYVAGVGFHGLFDIDFYESGGKMYFGEMNFRFGGSGYAVTRMGVNLPDMLVRSFRGESFENFSGTVSGTATYVNERMCIDDWSFYHITEKECRNILSSADIHFVYDNSDPRPHRKLERYIRKQKLKRELRKLLKKK